MSRDEHDAAMGSYPTAMLAGLPAAGPNDWPTCACGHSAGDHETIFDEGDALGDAERCTVEGCRCKGMRDA